MLNGWKRLSVFILIFILPACSRMHKNVSVDDGLKETLKRNQARFAIFLDSQGNIVATDKEGNALPQCTVKPGENQCRGLRKGAETLDLRTLTVIESKINPNCYSFIGFDGTAYEMCW